MVCYVMSFPTWWKESFKPWAIKSSSLNLSMVTVTKWYISERQILNLDTIDVWGLWSLCDGNLSHTPCRVFTRILRFKEHSLPISCSCDNQGQIPVSLQAKLSPLENFRWRGGKKGTKRSCIQGYGQRRALKCWANTDSGYSLIKLSPR